MSFIWTQTRFGKAFPLVNPDPALVDFKEIALTLAELPRYAGNFEKPISVAQHTLIALDACMAADGTALDRAYVLIHDAHEAYMGDITAPVAEALATIAGETGEATRAPPNGWCATPSTASRQGSTPRSTPPPACPCPIRSAANASAWRTSPPCKPSAATSSPARQSRGAR